jgi:hypothetical protein
MALVNGHVRKLAARMQPHQLVQPAFVAKERLLGEVEKTVATSLRTLCDLRIGLRLAKECGRCGKLLCGRSWRE